MTYKSADQPAHRRRLISTFVIRLLESIISKLAAGEFSIFLLVSVAKETGLSLTLLETQKSGFVSSRPISYARKSPMNAGADVSIKARG